MENTQIKFKVSYNFFKKDWNRFIIEEAILDSREEAEQFVNEYVENLGYSIEEVQTCLNCEYVEVEYNHKDEPLNYCYSCLKEKYEELKEEFEKEEREERYFREN